jgi:hypothetical protein
MQITHFYHFSRYAIYTILAGKEMVVIIAGNITTAIELGVSPFLKTVMEKSRCRIQKR